MNSENRLNKLRRKLASKQEIANIKHEYNVNTFGADNLTFTKKWVSRLLWCGVIWISLSYILAFLNKTQIAETLSGTVASVVIATILGYLLKAFFETYCEKKNELKKELSNKQTDPDNSSEDYDNSYDK